MLAVPVPLASEDAPLPPGNEGTRKGMAKSWRAKSQRKSHDAVLERADFGVGHISVQSPPHPNPRLTKANLHEDLEMHASSKTVPILKTEETAKYANYAKPESFRGKGLDFSRVSRVSRFKEFLGRGFGSAEDFLRKGWVLIMGPALPVEPKGRLDKGGMRPAQLPMTNSLWRILIFRSGVTPCEISELEIGN